MVAFTTPKSKDYLAVMNKIEMTDTGLNFMRQVIDTTTNLCKHVLYKITKDMWMANNC